MIKYIKYLLSKNRVVRIRFSFVYLEPRLYIICKQKKNIYNDINSFDTLETKTIFIKDNVQYRVNLRGLNIDDYDVVISEKNSAYFIYVKAKLTKKFIKDKY